MAKCLKYSTDISNETNDLKYSVQSKKMENKELLFLKTFIVKSLDKAKTFADPVEPLPNLVNKLCKTADLTFMPQVKINEKSIFYEENTRVLKKNSESSVFNKILEYPEEGVKLDLKQCKAISNYIIGASRNTLSEASSETMIELDKKQLEYSKDIVNMKLELGKREAEATNLKKTINELEIIIKKLKSYKPFKL